MVKFYGRLSTTLFKVTWHRVPMLSTNASLSPSALATAFLDKKVHLEHPKLALATNPVLLNHT